MADIINLLTKFVLSQQQKQPRDDEFLDPRDRIVTIDLPVSQNKLENGGLERFISELCKKVWSICFNAFSKGELTL